MRQNVVLVVVLVMGLAWARDGRASCTSHAPVQGIVTVPTDGDDYVRTDSKLWVLAGEENKITRVVWLASGENLVGTKLNYGWVRFELPELLPATEYKYRIFMDAGNGHSYSFGPLGFETGEGPWRELSMTTEGRLQMSEPEVWDGPYIPALCESLVSVQRCVDQGEIKLAWAPLSTAGADLVAVWQGSADPEIGCAGDCTFLPAQCGGQMYLDTMGLPPEDICVNVMALTSSGERTEVKRVCGESDSDGCAVSNRGMWPTQHTSPWTWLVLVSLIGLGWFGLKSRRA